MGRAADLCTGCARSSAEIAQWSQLPEAARGRIWDALPARRKQLGLKLHRLDWTREKLHSFLADTLRPGTGTWVSGVNGATAEFCIGSDDEVALETGERSICARSTGGGIFLSLPDHLRVLALEPAVENTRGDIIILVVPRGRAASYPNAGLTCLGADGEALSPHDRHAVLYDFGLGRQAAAFGLRTDSPALRADLDAVCGLPWADLLAEKGAAILSESPPRVMRNAIGRIEVYGKISALGTASRPGPHTHFQPDRLRQGGEAFSGIEIPESYVPCAIYYPS